MTTPNLDPQLVWCRPGERLLTQARPTGHLGSTVAGAVTAPHRCPDPQPEIPGSAPTWPLPTRVVSEGRFHSDEWAHDPALWGWAHADEPARLAVRVADLLAAGRGKAVLLLSTHRLAVASPAAPFTSWFEADVRHVTAVRAFGLLTSNWHREFVRADFADHSVLWWHATNARKVAKSLLDHLGV